jgi:hypothetical protein
MAAEKKARVTADVMQLLADQVITPYSGELSGRRRAPSAAVNFTMCLLAHQPGKHPGGEAPHRAPTNLPSSSRPALQASTSRWTK